MQYVYDNFVLRRAAEGRIFFVSPKMPFEYFVNCFHWEQPFFMVSQLEDGRISIIPNVSFIPFNLFEGYWPQNLLPDDFEYVTMKNETYPVIVSAHPVPSFDQWFRKFESNVAPFAKQTLSEFVAYTPEYRPLKLGRREEYKPEYKAEYRTAEALPT